MKCYYHSDSEVVAVCKICNKNLCKECYDLGDSGRCKPCITKATEQKHRQREFRIKNESVEYVRNAGIFSVLGAFIGYTTSIRYLSGIENSDIPALVYKLGFILLFAYLGISLICGLKIMNGTFRSMGSLGLLLIFIWPIYVALLIIALMIGMFCSVPLLLYHLYKLYIKPPVPHQQSM
ncbi:hypothetical protein HYG86_14410 [Alkalicella caledoniensis]|uniref:B box-type domain-containing protein n=1 Tax=Alkalicella caledoniensis TaxID=2731377 RepID=A0A7G9WB13_ALKCA|nr:hypothetical protein [Alkalicella caledoniensis]QNO15875.1 hypothetical protein HYG86_14410 [Alkalicella caledoniensis]